MKPLPPELEAKIDEVKSWMFDGDQKDVAKMAGVAESTVSQMLNKKRVPSKIVLDAGIEVMNKNKARFEIPTMKVA
jgi:hypothetical protein